MIAHQVRGNGREVEIILLVKMCSHPSRALQIPAQFYVAPLPMFRIRSCRLLFLLLLFQGCNHCHVVTMELARDSNDFIIVVFAIIAARHSQMLLVRLANSTQILRSELRIVCQVTVILLRLHTCFLPLLCCWTILIKYNKM